MSITRLQGNSVNSAGTVTSQAVTLPSGLTGPSGTAQSLAVASVACGSNNTTITGPTGWTQATINQPAGTNATIETSIWYLVVASGNAGQTSWTWTFSAAHTVYICIEEWSATLGWPSNPVDVSANGDTVGTPTQATTIVSGTAATSAQAEELWVASLAYKGSAQSESSITVGWTKDLEATLASNNTMTMLYNVTSATGAPNCQYVIGTAAYWAGCVVTFKDNAGLALSGTLQGVGTLSATLTLSAAPGVMAVVLSGAGTLTSTLSLLPPGAYITVIGGQIVFVERGTLGAQNTIGRSSQANFTVLSSFTVANLYGAGLYGAGVYPGLLSIPSPTLYQQFQQVQIYDQNGVLAFSGYLNPPKIQKPGFQPALETTITCIDQHWLALKRVVAKVYRNHTAGFIVQDMLTNILSAEGVTVGSIAAGPIVPFANFGYCTVSAALDALVSAASSSGIPYYWAIDQNKQIWFVPYTAIAGPVVDGTQVDDGRLSGFVPALTPGNPKFRNTQYAVGGVAQTGTNDETVQGDGQTRAFTFRFPLAATPSTFTLNGAAKTLGVKGQTGFQYYWAQGDPVIAQDSGQTLLVSTDRLRMVYIGQVPTVFTNNNPAQILIQQGFDGTSGIIESVLTDNTIGTAADGLAKVNQQLTQYGVPGQLFEFATMQAGFQPGQLCTVTYAPLGFAATQMLISGVDFSDQADGFNVWYIVHAVTGPYDTSWVNFFANLLQPATIANTINLGVALNIGLAPSLTLAPSTTLAPG